MSEPSGPLHLWRFDASPELSALAAAEAAALDVGAPVAPGLFVGRRPFEPGRAACAVGGGVVLARGPRGSFEAPPGEGRVHVVRGPWKVTGNPIALLAELGGGRLHGSRQGSELELYATAGDWLLVRPAPWPPHFVEPELPFRTSTSLPSRLARGVVNLVARPGDTLLDPVCGTGVLLVEALRIGCRARGGDLNPKAAAAARANLRALGLAGEVTVRDARTPPEHAPVDALVGDLPYGKRLAPSDLAPLLEALPRQARRWALVAHRDLSAELRAAGHAPRATIEVPKPTFSRYVHVGG